MPATPPVDPTEEVPEVPELGEPSGEGCATPVVPSLTPALAALPLPGPVVLLEAVGSVPVAVPLPEVSAPLTGSL